MAELKVIEKRYNGALLNLESDVQIKAEVVGMISSQKEIYIDIRANVIGIIDAPYATIKIRGSVFNRVEIMGGIKADKVDIKHAKCGNIQANQVKISHTFAGAVTARDGFL